MNFKVQLFTCVILAGIIACSRPCPEKKCGTDTQQHIGEWEPDMPKGGKSIPIGFDHKGIYTLKLEGDKSSEENGTLLRVSYYLDYSATPNKLYIYSNPEKPEAEAYNVYFPEEGLMRLERAVNGESDEVTTFKKIK